MKRILITLAVVAAAAAATLAWRPRTPIRIGVLHSLTGTMAISERALVDAVQMAVDEINQAGGVLGRQIEPIVADGRSDPGMFARETQRLITKAGTFSIHHVAPEVFGGFEETERGAKVATAEKALFDFAYLSSGRSRLFTSLPELELPRGFKRKELARLLAKIPSERSRTLTSQKLDELLAKATGA